MPPVSGGRLFAIDQSSRETEGMRQLGDNVIEVIRPCWLIATGDPERVEVLRSPLVRDDKSTYQPVRQYIADHGLVLAARETFEDADWMYGKVEMSVYVTPATRNASYAGVLA